MWRTTQYWETRKTVTPVRDKLTTSRGERDALGHATSQIYKTIRIIYRDKYLYQGNMSLNAWYYKSTALVNKLCNIAKDWFFFLLDFTNYVVHTSYIL